MRRPVLMTALTDIFGFLLIFPISRKFIFSKFVKKFNYKKEKNNFIELEKNQNLKKLIIAQS